MSSAEIMDRADAITAEFERGRLCPYCENPERFDVGPRRLEKGVVFHPDLSRCGSARGHRILCKNRYPVLKE